MTPLSTHYASDRDGAWRRTLRHRDTIAILLTYISLASVPLTIYATNNFTDEFRNASVTLCVCADWLAGRGGRGRHTVHKSRPEFKTV